MVRSKIRTGALGTRGHGTAWNNLSPKVAGFPRPRTFSPSSSITQRILERCQLLSKAIFIVIHMTKYLSATLLFQRS